MHECLSRDAECLGTSGRPVIFIDVNLAHDLLERLAMLFFKSVSVFSKFHLAHLLSAYSGSNWSPFLYYLISIIQDDFSVY